MKKGLVLLIVLLIVIWISLGIINNYYSPKTQEYISRTAEIVVSKNIKRVLNECINKIDTNNLVYVNRLNDVVSDVIINTNLHNEILKDIYNTMDDYYSDIIKNGFGNLQLPIGTIISPNVFIGRGFNVLIPIVAEGSYKIDLKTRSFEQGINTSRLEVVIEITFNIMTKLPLNYQSYPIRVELLLTSLLIQGKVPNYYYASNDLKSFPYVPSN